MSASLAEKQALVKLMDYVYLWPETLPANPDLAAAQTLPDLMQQLTAEARRQGLDRGWSQVTRENPYGPANHGSSHAGNQEVTYGLGAAAVVRDNRVLVSYVLSGSDADHQGVSRGDELVAAAATGAGLDLPANLGIRLLGSDGTPRTEAMNLFGPDGPVTVHVRLRKAGQPGTVDLALTKRHFPSDLVPEANRARVIHQDAGRRVGYLQLRAFRADADNDLRQACAHLGQAGVTDLIVDLRYNGGGLGRTAELLVNLLRGDARTSDVLWRTTYNSKRPSMTTWFNPQPESLRLRRIAVIVSDQTASSSEMVVNTLTPYLGADLALVGSRTYGKPVGMEILTLPGTGWTVLPVSVRNLNSAGFSHYSLGLPDSHFQGPAWAAADDLAHPQGDPAEASTAAALRWILGDTAGLAPIPPTFMVHAEAHADEAAADLARPRPNPYRGTDPDRPGLL